VRLEGRAIGPFLVEEQAQRVLDVDMDAMGQAARLSARVFYVRESRLQQGFETFGPGGERSCDDEHRA
jgi:hypothetical protein